MTEQTTETYCCPLAAGGDDCDCLAFAAEALAAFAPDRAITYDLRTDTWGWE